MNNKSELKSVIGKYSSKVPDSLTSQFENRVGKTDAVESYRDRQKREVTHLHPSGRTLKSANVIKRAKS